MSRLKKFLTLNNITFVAIVLLGVFFRFYEIKTRFVYGHDHDLTSWFIKDVVVDGHLRLIGQQTSTSGIFIGPFYYYFQIPFFLLLKMDPIAQVVASSLLGIFGIVTSYWVFSKVFDKKTGLIASYLYSISFFVVSNDREAVPTVLVIAWSIWFFYAISLLFRGEQKKGFLILGILVGLIWHLNVALVVVLPLVLVALFFSKKKLNLRSLLWGVAPLSLFSIPLVLFELRHNFIQIRSFLYSVTTSQGDIYSGLSKLLRVLFIVNKNISNFYWNFNDFASTYYLGLVVFVLAVGFLALKRYLKPVETAVVFTWLGVYVGFFSWYSKIVSEYYLNGLFVLYLIVLSRIFVYFSKKTGNVLLIIVLVVFGAFNANRFFNEKNPGNGYLQKLDLVEDIKNSAKDKKFDCVSISYITDTGYGLGYRYFFYLKGVRTSNNKKMVPTYTIVFPLGKDTVKEDKRFGDIGLIYPDFSRFSPEIANEECRKGDYNVIEPMFGFTK